MRERQAGTLEQLAVMPFRARDVFLGKIAPYLVLACVDLLVVVIAGIFIFNVPFVGNAFVFALGSLLFLFLTLGVGVLISTVSQTQGQAIQLAMMSMLPQILLSGFIFPLNAIVPAVRWISYLLPLTYFVPIARGVWVRGADIGSLWFQLVMLAVLGLVVFTASVVRFRRDLAPDSRRGRRSGDESAPAGAGAAAGGEPARAARRPRPAGQWSRPAPRRSAPRLPAPTPGRRPRSGACAS